uniref:Uncharacterized protein n=1 Tax=Chromera velia CCMP2878 TaxID=1169474 RepID=A0A0K6S9C9_9ALVE|eukprot:Cvel_7444.t2-p1 / transcript=Cvel_7444.t2 / gene=Cvel_7444 / organism=Chromera_velia_CCMP2878 / gene_product=hypothetical protein / transcript_product=hypothetical protein / location=Cvel_scaffold389:26635-31513(-) / protein_length=942 / sequence_SO=supercontig / SO=protein_coding / is_pseudo=false
MRQPRGLHLCAGDWSRKDTRSPERLSYVFRITCGLPKRDRPHQTSAPPAPFGLSPSVEPREGGLGLPSALPRKTEDGVFSEQRKLAFFPLEEISRSRGGGESEEDEDADSESAGQTPMEERCSPHSDAVDSRSTNMVGADGDKTARGGKGIDRPVASLFASPPPERQFHVNTISARSRPPQTHTQPGRHWAGIPFERFHIRLAFDQDSEMIAFLESLTDQQGQRTLQIVRDGFRQLITDVLDYRGVVPHSGERQWTVGTDKSSDGDRAASLGIGISVEGQEEVVFMMGMHLRRLDKKVKPSVEDLEFWVDRRYMEEVLEEWGQAPKEMVDLVRRCRRVESRRATDLWRFALKVDLALPAFLVSSRLLFHGKLCRPVVAFCSLCHPTRRELLRELGGRYQKTRRSTGGILSPLWKEARNVARLVLGGRRAELPFLHPGVLCTARLKSASWDPTKLVNQARLKYGEVSLHLPIHVLPSIETAGSEDARDEEMLHVYECLSRASKNFLSCRVGPTISTSAFGPASGDPGLIPLPVPVGSGMKRMKLGDGESAEPGAPLPLHTRDASLRSLADSGCISSVRVSGPTDRWDHSAPFLVVNILFDLSWRDDPSAHSPTGEFSPPTSSTTVLSHFEEYLIQCAEAEGVRATHRNRGKNRLFRVIQPAWLTEVECMVRLARGSSESSAENPPRGVLLMQYILHPVGKFPPRMTEKSEILEAAVQRALRAVLSAFVNTEAATPLSHRLSLSERGEADSTVPRLEDRETALNERCRGLWVGSFDPAHFTGVLEQKDPDTSSAVSIAAPSSRGRAPNDSQPLLPTPSTPLELSSASATSLLGGQDPSLTLSDACRGLSGKIVMELKAPRGRQTSSAESLRPKETKQETGTSASSSAEAETNPSFHSSPWLQKRLQQNGRSFFLPAAKSRQVTQPPGGKHTTDDSNAKIKLEIE